MPESLLEELGYKPPRPEEPVEEKPQSLLGELGYGKPIQQPVEKPSKLQIAKSIGLNLLVPPWTRFVMKQARRPQKAVIAGLETMQKPTLPEDVGPYDIRNRVMEEIAISKEILENMWKGFTGKKDVRGTDIVKNMFPKIPYDDPKWKTEHPQKHLAYEFAGAFYEVISDPITWYMLGRAARPALAQRIGQEKAKKLDLLRKLWEKKHPGQEATLKNVEFIYDKSGNLYAKSGDKILFKFSDQFGVQSFLSKKSYFQLRNILNNMKKFKMELKTPAYNEIRQALLTGEKGVPPIAKGMEVGKEIAKVTKPWDIMRGYTIKDPLSVVVAKTLEVGDILKIPTIKGKSITIKINNLPKAKKFISKLLDKGRDITMEAREYPDVPEEKQTLEQLIGQKENIKGRIRDAKEVLKTDIDYRKRASYLGIVSESKKSLIELDKLIAEAKKVKVSPEARAEKGKVPTKPEKKPWEMTLEELKPIRHTITKKEFGEIGLRTNFSKEGEVYYRYVDQPQFGRPSGTKKIPVSDKEIKRLRNQFESSHKYYVEKALSEGKSVPPEVLADYPDLKPTKVKAPIKPKVELEAEVGKPSIIKEIKPDTKAKINEMYKKAMDIADKEGDRGLVKKLQKELQFIGGSITQPSEMRKLRALAHAWRSRKGLTGKAFREIVKKVSGHIHTTHKAVTEGQLKEIISKIKDIRPKRIGYKTVITEKTENQISMLKENLIKTKSLTDDIFNKILKKENIKYPGWGHKNNFITEETGKKLIKRMVNEAPIYKNEIEIDITMVKNPQVKKLYDAGRRFIEEKAKRVQASPNKAIINTMKDWRFISMDMEEQTGELFYGTYHRLTYNRRNVNVMNDKEVDRVFQKGGKEINRILADKKRIEKIEDWVASFLKEPGTPKRPTNMTNAELAIAKEMQNVLKEYEPKIRYIRFFDWRNKGTRIPDATDKQLDEALDILNTEGPEALKKHLKKQKWGVIGSGYDIREVYRPRVTIKKVKPAPGRAHLKIREGVKYRKSDRDIFQRFVSYVKQINTHYYLMEDINSLRSLFENNADKFKQPKRIEDAFNRLLGEVLQQRNVPTALMNWVTKPYAQAMRAIFLDPYKYVRNLIQNVSFYASPQDFFNILEKSPLSETDKDYYFRQASQMTGLKHDYFMQHVGLPGFGKVNKVVDRVNLYPKTDDINRVMCYIFKLGRIRKAMKKYPDNFNKMVVSAGFGDLQLLQRMEAMKKYVIDKQDMARYLSVEVGKDVHFIYEREARGSAEQGGDFEKVASNLLTFRKGYVQRIWNNINQLRPSRKGVEAPYGARRRSFRILTQMILVTTLAGWIFKRVVGRKRNPYSPLAIVDDISLGGIPFGSQEQIGQLTHDVMDALQGDKRALGVVVNTIPGVGDMYIPFYRTIVDITESVFGYKNVDRAILRKIRSALDKRYKAKPMGYYEIERNAVEKFQHALFGGRPAEARIIEEKAKKKKEEEEMTPLEKEEAKRRKAYEKYKKGE